MENTNPTIATTKKLVEEDSQGSTVGLSTSKPARSQRSMGETFVQGLWHWKHLHNWPLGYSKDSGVWKNLPPQKKGA